MSHINQITRNEALFISENEDEILEKWENVYFDDVIEFFVKGQIVKIKDSKIYVFFEKDYKQGKDFTLLESIFNVSRDSRIEYLAKLQANVINSKTLYSFPFKDKNLCSDNEIMEFVKNNQENHILLESGITIQYKDVPCSYEYIDEENCISVILKNCKDKEIKDSGMNAISFIMSEYDLEHMDRDTYEIVINKKYRELSYNAYVFKNYMSKNNIQMIFGEHKIERFYNTKKFKELMNNDKIRFIFSYHLDWDMKIDLRVEDISDDEILIVDIKDYEVLKIIKNAGGIKSLNEKKIIMNIISNEEKTVKTTRRRI